MKNLFIKLFIKDYDNVQSPKVRKAYGFLAGAIAVICNALLSASKIVVGFLTASVSVIADGINNLSDTGSGIVSIFGFKMADRPADEKHPFGHARMEYAAGLIIACIVLVIGIQLIISSVEKIIDKSAASANIATFIILSISIVVKLWLGFFNRSIGKKIGSTPLKASATDAFNDVVATTVVLIGAIINRTTNLQIDGYLGVAVALFVVFNGIKLIQETLSPLIGERPDNEVMNKLIEKICCYDGVLNVHDVVAHNYGVGKYYISLHVEVDSTVDIMVSHDLVDKIERELSVNGITLVIHMDPILVNDPATDKYRRIAIDALAQIDPQLTMHDFRAVVGKAHNNLIFDVVTPFHYKYSDAELKELIEKNIKQLDKKCFSVVNIDKKFIG